MDITFSGEITMDLLHVIPLIVQHFQIEKHQLQQKQQMHEIIQHRRIMVVSLYILVRIGLQRIM